MRIVWSPLALERVTEVAEYIARDRPLAAERWVDGVFAAVRRLEAYPLSGRVVPEACRSDLREIIHGGFRILYRTEPAQLSILTLRHVRQALDAEQLDEILSSTDPA